MAKRPKWFFILKNKLIFTFNDTVYFKFTQAPCIIYLISRFLWIYKWWSNLWMGFETCNHRRSRLSSVSHDRMDLWSTDLSNQKVFWLFVFLNIFLYCLVFRKISSGFRNDSVAFLRFDFQRQSGFFLLGIYFPLTLIVMCSWVSFWIVKTDVPSRVALGRQRRNKGREVEHRDIWEGVENRKIWKGRKEGAIQN